MAVEKQVNVIISAVDQFSGVLTGLGGSFKMIALGAGAVEAAILAASVAAAKFAIDIGTDVFVAATDFHDAVFDIEAVASSFGTTAGEISDVLDNLVNKFPVTGKEGGEALQLIAQMGYGAEEQLAKVSDASMTLSIATGTELRTSAEGTMAIMNSFGLSLEEVDRVINLLAATSFTSAASVSDLREAMKFAASTSALAGISLEETAAILGKLKDKGLEASMAGTTYRMAMVQVTKESTKGEIALAKYGLTYDDVNPSVVGLTGMIEAFGNQILSADDAQDIFGTRAKTIALVINDGAESFKDYTKEITGTNAAYEAAEIKLGKWGVVIANVDGSIDLFKKTIAAELVPTLIKLVGKTKDDGIRGVITQLQAMEEISGAIGKPMVDLFESLKESAEDLFKDAFGDVEGFYNYLADISNALSTNLEIIGIWGLAFAETFVGSTDDADELETMLHLVNGAIAALATPVAVIHDLFVGFFYALNLGWDLAEGTFTGFAYLLTSGLVKIAELMDVLPFVDMSDRIAHMSKQADYWKIMMKGAFDTEPPELWMKKVGEVHAKGTDAIIKFGDEAKETYKKVEKAAVDWSDKISKAAINYELAKSKLDMLAEGGPELVGTTEEWTKAVAEAEEEYKKAETELKKVTSEAEKLENAHSKAATAVVTWKEKLDKVTEKYEEAKKKAEEGGDSTGEAAEEVTKWAVEVSEVSGKYDEAKKKADESKTAAESITDETLLWGKELLGADEKTKAIAKTTKDLAKASGETTEAVKETKKELSEIEKLELKMEMEKFKSDLKIAEMEVENAHNFIMGKLEWEAKINVAEIEAAADVAVAEAGVMESAFASVSESIAGISGGLGAIAGIITGGDLWGAEKWAAWDMLEAQVQMQQDLVDAQTALLDAQVKYMDAKTEKMKEGLAEIQVEVLGDMEGWLKGLTQSLFDKIMVKAQAEAFSCFGVE